MKESGQKKLETETQSTKAWNRQKKMIQFFGQEKREEESVWERTATVALR